MLFPEPFVDAINCLHYYNHLTETFVEATDTQILPVVDDAFIDVDGIAATTSFYKGKAQSHR